MAIPVEGLYLAKALGRGKIAEHNPMTNIRSYAASGVDIAFGLAVMEGVDLDKQVRLFTSGTGKFKGVAGYSISADDLDNGLFTTGDMVPVVDQGVVMVYVEEAVTPSSPVRIRHTGGTPGAFRTSSSGGASALITGAEFRGSGASGTAVPLFLSPPFTVTAD